MRAIRKDVFEPLIKDEDLAGVSQIPEINNPAVQAKRSALFTKAQEINLRQVGRIEKINVEYEGLPQSGNYLMNRFTSTPFDCAKRMFLSSCFI